MACGHEVTIDLMLDEISRWRAQSRAWEQLSHELAETITKDLDPSQVLVSYARQVRAKYRPPRAI